MQDAKQASGAQPTLRMQDYPLSAALPLSGPWSEADLVTEQGSPLDWHAAAQDYADLQWAAHLAKHPRSFNGKLAGLTQVTRHATQLRLDFRQVDFRAYVASRYRGFHEAFPTLSRADPLGLTAIVVTADTMVVATQRAWDSDQNAGQLYLVGGYMELNPQGLARPFEEAMREVEEELGLGRAQLRTPRLIGLSYDPEVLHPEAYFLMPTECTFSQIKLLADDAHDGHEHAKVIGIPWQQFLAGSPATAFAHVTWSYEQARMHALKLSTR